jgi:hypothetical protein
LLLLLLLLVPPPAANTTVQSLMESNGQDLRTAPFLERPDSKQ